jgi:hypothetical protein
VLQQARDILAVVAVPVAHTEEMAMAQLEHMRVGQVGILVLLVGVVRRDSTLCCERKLGDRVLNFFAFLCGSGLGRG